MTIVSILFTLVFNVCTTVQANDLREYQEFFDDQLQGYKAWLMETRLSPIITVDSLVVEAEKVFLLLQTPDKRNWARLDEHFTNNYDKSLGEVLFDKFLFQADLEENQLELEIEGADAFILVYPEMNKLKTEIRTKMGPVSDELEIPIGDLKLSRSVHLQTSKMFPEVKQILIQELEQYFESYDAHLRFTKLLAKYKFKGYDIEDKKLSIVVSNVVDLILDEGYFEHIQIDFQFRQEQDILHIKYDIEGKYAAGIFRAPYESRYHDMQKKYAEQLDKFKKLEFKSEVNKILSK